MQKLFPQAQLGYRHWAHQSTQRAPRPQGEGAASLRSSSAFERSALDFGFLRET